MARCYFASQISENIKETPEGFLICLDVPIARAGELIYAPNETPITPGDGNTVVNRSDNEITSTATMASFEGKPVTLNHPADFVTPENWKALTVGVVQNVRASNIDGGVSALIADLFITDASAIMKVRNKELREVSCGYDAEYLEIAPGRGLQQNIVGNHVALVVSGRCGAECAIHDHAPERKEFTMIERLKAAISRSLDQAIENVAAEEPTSMMVKIMNRLDSIESQLPKPKAVASNDEAMGKTEEMDHTPEQMVGLEERLARIEAAIARLEGAGEVEDAKPEEESAEVDAYKDEDTVSRAEIIAPGIAKTADVKSKALDACYSTIEGRQVIDTLLAGRSFDEADKDMLFVAASEMMKGVRRSQLATRITIDSFPGLSSGPITPEKLNEINAEKYGLKK